MSEFDAWAQPQEGYIDATRKVGKHVVVFRASDVRKRGDAPYAKLTIGVDGAKALTDKGDWDVEKRRHDFANRMYGTPRYPGKFKSDIKSAYPQDEFEHDLLLFCEQFRSKMLGHQLGEYYEGDEELSEIDHLLEGMVLREGGTIMYAAPKSGKSYTGLAWAVSIDSGCDALWNVNQAVVFYINLERGKKSMLRRLGLVNRALGLPPSRTLLMLHRRGRTLAEVYDEAAKTIETYGVQHVIVDSLSRAGSGDMNGNQEANDSMDYLNRLCPSWTAIAHTPYGDEGKIFGSRMFAAAMDVGVNVQKQRLENGTLGLLFSGEDTNDTGPVPKRILAYEFDAKYGLSKIRDAYPHEFPDLEDVSRPRTLDERVYDQLLAHGPNSISGLKRDMALNSKSSIDRSIKRLLNDNQIREGKKDGRSLLFEVVPRDVPQDEGSSHHPPPPPKGVGPRDDGEMDGFGEG